MHRDKLWAMSSQLVPVLGRVVPDIGLCRRLSAISGRLASTHFTGKVNRTVLSTNPRVSALISTPRAATTR